MNFSRFFFRVVVVVAAAAAVSDAVVIFINIIRLLYAIELQSGISHSLPYLWMLANSNNSNSNSKREIRRRNGWIKKTRAYKMPQYRYAHTHSHIACGVQNGECACVCLCVYRIGRFDVRSVCLFELKLASHHLFECGCCCYYPTEL